MLNPHSHKQYSFSPDGIPIPVRYMDADPDEEGIDTDELQDNIDRLNQELLELRAREATVIATLQEKQHK